MKKLTLGALALLAAGAGLWAWWGTDPPPLEAEAPELSATAVSAAAPASAGAALPPLTAPLTAPLPASAPTSAKSQRPDWLPLKLGSEGYGPHIQRHIEAGSPESVAKALKLLSLCAAKATRTEMSEQVRTEQWGGAVMAKLMLEALAGAERACQTVVPELLAQRTALAERLVAAQWPGAVLLYERTLDRGADRRWPTDVAQKLAEMHRAAAVRGDEASLRALVRYGSLYELEATERRAWGHLVKRCFPAGLRAEVGSDEREPFYFFEEEPDLIKAFAARGRTMPPPDPKVETDGRALAATWSCPATPG